MRNNSLIYLKRELQAVANPQKAKFLQGYFRTGPGEYGEGDIFLGIPGPVQRKIARRFASIPLGEVIRLLKSPTHDHRFVALEILEAKYEKAEICDRARIVRACLKNTRYINNWDLVDNFATRLLGNHLLRRSRTILYKLARSKNIWERRIAIVATRPLILHGEYDDTLAISKSLLNDPHDLIHKATGWMLREVGNRSRREEEKFLQKHAHLMPRTMLRYAIERFPEQKRKTYLARGRPRSAL